MRILITGAANEGSLGYHIARNLHATNHKLILMGLEDKPRSWPDDSGIEYIRCNLGDYGEIQEGVAYINGVVDGIIHCAGINRQDWIEDINPKHWMDMMQVNALAPVLLAGDLLRSQRLRSPGSFICNIVSNASHIPMTASNGYNASKGALHISTLQMARELTPKYGISVFGISPNKLAGTGMSKQIEREVERVRGWTPEFARDYQIKALLNKQETPPQVVADFITGIINNAGVTRFLSGCILPIGA